MSPHACLLLVLAMIPSAANDRVTLAERWRAGETSLVTLQFKADGDLLVPQGDQKNKSQAFSATARLVFEEKTMAAAADPSAVKCLRYYISSTLHSTVENNRVFRELREPVRLVVAEWRQGRPFLFSPSAPLTVDEYELIEADASLDSLALGGLLPATPVAVNDTWQPSNEAVAAVFNMTHIGQNAVHIRLEKLDDATATISLAGHVEGICNGTATLRNLAGKAVFDRTQSKFVQLDLNQREQRKAGPLGSAIDARASYSFQRSFSTPIKHLNDPALDKLPLDSNPATELLAYAQPDGRYRFYLPRGWFVTMSHPQGAILRLIENGEFISECHVLPAPTVAAGTHMKPDEFRAQVQQALGKQFQQFIQQGEVPAPQGLWCYRLAAAGTSGDQPAIWIYHLAASPQGQQLLFVFRIHASQADHFGVKDLAVVGTLEFEPAKTAAGPAESPRK